MIFVLIFSVRVAEFLLERFPLCEGCNNGAPSGSRSAGTASVAESCSPRHCNEESPGGSRQKLRAVQLRIWHYVKATESRLKREQHWDLINWLRLTIQSDTSVKREGSHHGAATKSGEGLSGPCLRYFALT